MSFCASRFYISIFGFVFILVLIFRVFVVFHIKRQSAHAMSEPRKVQKSDTGIA